MAKNKRQAKGLARLKAFRNPVHLARFLAEQPSLDEESQRFLLEKHFLPRSVGENVHVRLSLAKRADLIEEVKKAFLEERSPGVLQVLFLYEKRPDTRPLLARLNPLPAPLKERLLRDPDPSVREALVGPEWAPLPIWGRWRWSWPRTPLSR